MAGYENSEIEIAALKKKEAVTYNLMMPGAGTPWEDRGRSGLVTAFFKTCWRSLFSHRSLLDQIRRPETTQEATGFAVGCALLWGLSIALWDIWNYLQFNDPTKWNVNGQQYFIESAVRVAVMVGMILLLLKLGSGFFSHLLANSAGQQVPSVLVFNVFSYSLGPSLLAVVPVVGWGLAGLWIFVDVIIGAKTRLYLRTREAVINTILVFAGAIVILLAVYFAGVLLRVLIYGDPAVTPNIPLPLHPLNGAP
jgi:hypothetical protein